MEAEGRALRVQRVVAGPPARVYARFVDEVDRWWRHGPRFRRLPRGRSRMRFTGAALLEEGDGTATVVARIVAAAPPERLELELEGAPVVLTFAPHPAGTLVTVVHGRPPDGRTAFQDPRGPWWGELLAALGAAAPSARIPARAPAASR